VSAMIRYLLDANVFIEAKRRYYAFDICPGYWEALLAHHEGERLASIDRIRNELLRGHDDLTEWVEREIPGTFFLSTADARVTRYFGEMMRWVQEQAHFLPAAKAEFAQEADGWLAAYAKAYDFMLATHEVLNHASRNRVPLPNVCEAFNVPYTNTFDMLRGLETQFEWRHTP